VARERIGSSWGISLNTKELHVEGYAPTPKGGMCVGMPKGVRVTHIPTGIEVICESERSMYHNRLKAIEMITKLVDEHDS